MNDPRVEAATRAIRHAIPGTSGALLVLEAADQADREQGIHRVRVDDATVERVARALWDHDMAEESPEWREMAWNDMGGSEPSWERGEYEIRARAVLAALTGAGS